MKERAKGALKVVRIKDGKLYTIDTAKGFKVNNFFLIKTSLYFEIKRPNEHCWSHNIVFVDFIFCHVLI